MTSLKPQSVKTVMSVPIPVNFFYVTFEDHERDQEQVHGFEPFPIEHDDIACAPLAHSDNEDDTMTSKLPYICCASVMKAFLND